MVRFLLVLLFALGFGQTSRAADEPVYPGKVWITKKPADVGMDASRLKEARDYAFTGGGSGLITRHGYLVMSWGDVSQRFDLKSTTKSIGATALGLAIGDGKLKLSDKAADRHPQFGTPPDSNAKTGWLGDITLKHLATQTAGFAKPGGYEKLLFPPGTKWSYSDGGPNWLAECITLAYRRDIEELMFERIFTPLGITHQDLTWRNNQYRPHKIEGIARREFGAGVHANVNAMARIGYLHLRNGKWRDKQILPSDFVKQAGTTVKKVVGLPEVDPAQYGNASDHYGLLWWNNADGTIAGLPRDAYWSWGLYDSLIVVIPSLDVVAARAGKSWKRTSKEHYAVLEGFLQPIAASVKNEPSASAESESKEIGTAKTSQAPYPPSPVFQTIEWAPAETIVRKARGSDNWPTTWGDDDRLYTAYGDGRGFEPFVDRKLSLGLAVVSGMPPNIQGENLRSPTAEQIGDGAKGKKASGILMIEGVLYLWARNAGNSQLAWSNDRGKTWEWCDWKFATSFGCPTFLQFGKNYAGARDEFVYIYSQDSDSAYQRADRMLLVRVPKDQLRNRARYEFFESLETGEPRWTKQIENRGAVFVHAGACYRSGVSYHPPTKRYLWCQTGKGEDTRFQGGVGIYDAPAPWGPWTTVYYTEDWDVGSGETSSFPTRWMDPAGKTAWLVFSGDDHFSVRKAILRRRSP